MRDPMHEVLVTLAPDGALFVSIPLRVDVGEPELRLVVRRDRWVAFWCGRRVGSGAVARA